MPKIVLLLLLFLVSLSSSATTTEELIQSCNYSSINQLQKDVRKSIDISGKLTKIQKTSLITLLPHIKKKHDKRSEEWEMICGSVLFELKIEKNQKYFHLWSQCISPSQGLSKEGLFSIKKCIKKILKLSK